MTLIHASTIQEQIFHSASHTVTCGQQQTKSRYWRNKTTVTVIPEGLLCVLHLPCSKLLLYVPQFPFCRGSKRHFGEHWNRTKSQETGKRQCKDSHLSLPEPGRLQKQRFRKTNESQENFIQQLTTQSIELKEFTDVTIWGPGEELQHD